MRERDIFVDFAKEVFEAPVTIALVLLDLAGIAAVIYWVVDDVAEALVVLIFFMVVHVGFYLVYRRTRLELATYEKAKPAIRFSRVRHAQMYQDSVFAGKRIPTYRVHQVWFSNSPTVPTEATVAKDVTARIKLLNSDSSMMFQWHGQWSDSNAPDNVGFEDMLDSITINPGHLEAKLLIALKYHSDSDAYAFAREGLRSTPDGRSARYQIEEGNYSLSVQLLGVGVNELFEFDLQNPGTSKSLELEYAGT